MATQGQPANIETPPLPGDGSGEAETDTSNGYVIEIDVAADNSITVSVEPKSTEDAEEQGGGASTESADEDSQPVSSIREACKLVMEIYSSQGELPDTGASDAAMQAGYKPGM